MVPHYVGLHYTRVTPVLRAKLSALIPVQPLFHSLPEDDFYACWSTKLRLTEPEVKSIEFCELKGETQKLIL